MHAEGVINCVRTGAVLLTQQLDGSVPNVQHGWNESIVPETSTPRTNYLVLCTHIPTMDHHDRHKPQTTAENGNELNFPMTIME